MAVKDSWPYIDTYHRIESDDHVKLKNLAIYWLLDRGFSVGDIEAEYFLGERFGAHAYTDIYANNGSVEAFVECETGGAHINQLSGGGKVPAKNDEAVFYFDKDGIHRLVYREIETHHHWRPEETVRARRPRLEHLGQLPLLDLSAFKG